jgi:chaperone BCS1
VSFPSRAPVMFFRPRFSLLFATTNHIERLDPALSRPGRMDVWINFKNATGWQAEEIFKNFFPCKRPEPPTPPTSQDEEEAAEQKPKPKPKRKTQIVPILEENELADLAKRFGDAIPEEEMSVSGGSARVCFG